jgi:hypothetical protein
VPPFIRTPFLVLLLAFEDKEVSISHGIKATGVGESDSRRDLIFITKTVDRLKWCFTNMFPE